VQNPISLNTPFFYIHFQRFSLLLLNFPISLIWFPAPFFSLFPSLSYFSTSPVSLLWFLAPIFSGFPALFFSGFPVALSYFSRLLFTLFEFFLSKFSSFHVSDDFFLLWVSCTVLLWVSCGSLLFLQVIISSFWVFLIKVSFFSCF